MRHETRRGFLKTAGVATSIAMSGLAVPRQALAHANALAPASAGTKRALAFTSIHDPEIRALANRALDAARTAGATFADVRVVRQRMREVGDVMSPFNEREDTTVGVRALVNGYWGFTAAGFLSNDEMVRLGREAVAVARSCSAGKAPPVEFIPAPVVTHGHWEMPVGIDPLTIHAAQIEDFLQGMRKSAMIVLNRYNKEYRELMKFGPILSGAQFRKQERAYASTDGSYTTQVLYGSQGHLRVGNEHKNVGGDPQFRLTSLSSAGTGWEMFSRADIHDEIERAVLKWVEDVQLRKVPVDIGRYSVVLDAESVARIMGATLGAASELDRAVGYGANESGTSFLGDPSEASEPVQIGSPLLTVRCNRTAPGGAATVGWDDDGVKPQDATLIEKGVLQTFQTTRETAAWIRTPVGMAPRLTGNATAATGADEPLCRSGNLVVEASNGSSGYSDMIQELERGIVMENLNFNLDFQKKSGMSFGRAYEVRNGKIIGMLQGAGVLFYTSELMKSISAIGNRSSARQFGQTDVKGEPAQVVNFSVTTPPMRFNELTVVEVRRKA